MSTPANIEDPDYNPEPIDKLDPTVMGIKTLEKYIDKFDKELEELREIKQKWTVKELTMAKRDRRDELESKLLEFEVERKNWLANREKALGGSKREIALEPSKSAGISENL